MTRSSTLSLLTRAAVVPLAAVALAACGGASSGSAASPTTASGRPATVGIASGGNLGKILVDSQGRTLYLFQKDNGTKSACYGACASSWPPLRASGKPTIGGGANASLVATTARSDGKPQVTYGGHPLYLFQGDQKAGDTNGQGVTAFGGGWFTLSAAGQQVAGKPASSGGGNGY
jgi:predicted lipoprotein with Yx(FWY)xxD motif